MHESEKKILFYSNFDEIKLKKSKIFKGKKLLFLQIQKIFKNSVSLKYV